MTNRGPLDDQPRQGESRFSKLAWLEAILRSDLNGMTKLVGAILGTYARSGDGRNAHPGRKRLADDLNVSTSTIDRALKQLVSLRWVDRLTDGRAAPKRDWADVYRLVMPTDQSSVVTSSQDVNQSAPVQSSQDTDQSSVVADQSSFEPDQSSNGADQSSQLCRPIRSSTSGPLHSSGFSKSNRSAPQGAGSPAPLGDHPPDPDDDAMAEELERQLLDYLNDMLGSLDEAEESTASRMYFAGSRIDLIVDTLRADRDYVFDTSTAGNGSGNE